ncbi:altronate dehydratase family protein [Azohydromonas lata]|uniref:Altronate dehydratase family protein n=1 Tax=Azohydromonas lata TaxID=45677 RepID=A0ABU5I9I7_9BURK|nr:altronate dehydratase family protein [Azohydromonas lata]MDZ5455764.1 altronate dehydratase family protein [Azohydromonas lata]
MNTPTRMTIRLHAQDNAVVAARPLAAGMALADEGIQVQQDVPAGHKLAARPLRAGEAVRLGDAVIGVAAADTLAGVWLHGHNVTAGGDVEAKSVAAALAPVNEPAAFQGIVRADGRVATRNCIGVFVVGNCGATAARRVADWFTPKRLAAFANVDGVVPFVHEIGCGMEMTGEPMDLLRRTIAGTIRNPNIAGALVIALGCERNNLQGFLDQEKLVRGPMLHTLVMQDIGGTQATIDAGIAAVQAMLPAANDVRRETVPVSKLVVGLHAASPDGFSAACANLALGAAVDLLRRHGGTALVAGSSDLALAGPGFTARAATPDVAEQLAQRAHTWHAYTTGRDTQINRRARADGASGGLTTAAEKALGNLRCAGSGTVDGVIRFADPVTASGLVFMDAPTQEAVAVTGQIASGATLVAMTTGQGTVFGSQMVPVVKLASHGALFERMADDLDMDCQPVVDGTASVDEMGRAIFERLLRHASGEKTCAEDLGVGENEFVPWPIGVLA